MDQSKTAGDPGQKRTDDSWQDHGVTEGKEYAILTNEISKAWSGMTTRQYKDLKSMRMRKYY